VNYQLNIAFMNNYYGTLQNSFYTLGPAILNIAARLIVALAIFIIGWIIGVFVESIVEKVFKKLNVDNALRRAGVESTLQKGGITLNSGHFVGALLKWFIIIIFLISSFDVLNLTQVTDFLKVVVIGYLPQIIIAVLILMVAAVVGDVVQRIVRGSTGAAGVKASHFLGAIAKWVIWIFALLTVLVQLGIGADLIRILFTGIVVAGAIAFGIAFGLGGQTHASQLIEKIKKEVGHGGEGQM
jgi:small-conductance mechanosensitive channel